MKAVRAEIVADAVTKKLDAMMLKGMCQKLKSPTGVRGSVKLGMRMLGNTVTN